MLQQLPIAATAEVWLCDALNTALENGFACIQANLPIPPWLDFIPEQHHAVMARRGKLADAIEAVFAAYQALPPDGQADVRNALEDQQELDELFSGFRAARPLHDLPETMHAPLKEYASRVFDVLNDTLIRDRAYEVYDQHGFLACPFCGYEAFDSSRLRQMDWDHYLARSLYPFAGADLRNFSPMGDGCNARYKRSKDVLRSNGGVRRPCFDPYHSAPATISLTRSQLFTRGEGSEMPEWQIDLIGDDDRCASWDSIFEVRARWLDRLDRIYDKCLSGFREVHRGHDIPDDALAGRLAQLAAAEHHPPPETGAMLRAAVYTLRSGRAGEDTDEGARLRRLLRTTIATNPLPT